MVKSIIIIGAGMGGLAAGVYGQMNGYKTQIFEMHTQPGGQCTAWKRKGYTFDVCIHHLFGCNPKTYLYKMWNELGAMPRPMIATNECTSVLSADGKKLFMDYYDLKKLEEHMLELAPDDATVIREYIYAINLFLKNDFMEATVSGSRWSLWKQYPFILTHANVFNATMQGVGRRFTDPFLKKAFPLLVYSMPATAIMLHLVRHAYGIKKNILWPEGGALEFSRSIAQRYQEQGGTINYGSKVVKILVKDNRATGVKLADGREFQADMVISNADGRRTILEMLDGKYINDMVRGYCAEPQDETIMSVHVFLGVNRDLSKEPSAMIMLLDQPEEIAGHKTESIEMQIYGFDQKMAPPGKGVIKVELTSGYSYWKKLYADKTQYEAEKEKVAQRIITILEKRFPGIREQVEVIDVPTLMTWEKYMGGTHGWFNFPVRKFKFGNQSNKNWINNLPGLSNFYMVGVWSTLTGALFMNALSGKRIIQTICKKDGRKFLAKVRA